MKNNGIIPIESIINRIYLIRNQKVMLDSDLAELYEVETRVVNQAVKRNINRFPEDFMFQLTKDEFKNLISQIVMSSDWGGRRHPPHAFTEHGAVMLATVLNSDKANKMSVFIVRAFIELRNILSSNKKIARKVEEIEKQVDEQGKTINIIVSAVQHLLNESKKPLPPLKEIKGFRNE